MFVFFQGSCASKKCNKSFSPFYEENVVEGVVLRKFYKPKSFFGCTSESVFEMKLVKQVIGFVTLCNAEFVNFCQVYNDSNDETLGKHTLMDVFFCANIAMKIPDCPLGNI